MPLLIRKVVDADGTEWVIRRLVRESARLNDSDRRISLLRCYGAGRKVEVRTDCDWEELSDAALLSLISRAEGGGGLDRGCV
jgi:hypothetical protein